MVEIEIANSQLKPLVKMFLDRFFAVLTAAYIGGIVIVRLFLEGSAGAYILALSVAGLLIAVLHYKYIDLYRVIILLLVTAAGGIAFFYALQEPVNGLTALSGSPLYIEGTVADEPLFYEDHSAYCLKVDLVENKEGRMPVSGKLLVKIYGAEQDHYRFGERLRLRGVIVEPRGLRNPGGFDYRYYLRSQGIDALIYPLPSQVNSLGTGKTNLLSASAIRLRSALVNAIETNLPSPSAELLAAVLFGQRERLPEEIANNFRRAGTGHLMAVSGLHVGLVAALILGLRRLLNLQGSYFLVLAIIVVFGYAYLTGMRPSALRAAVMVAMVLGAIILDREHDLPTAISLAALVTLFINPLQLFTVGFQLSYAATLSLIYAYRPLEQLLRSVRCPAVLAAPMAVTLAAQLGVLPLSVYYFHYLPLGALFFNLLLMPFTALVVGLGLTGALLSLLCTLPGAIVLWASRPLLEIMLYLTALSDLAGLYRAVHPPHLLFLFGYYALMAVLLLFYYRRLEDLGREGNPNLGDLLRPLKMRLMSKRRFYRRLSVGLVLVLAVLMLWSGIFFPTGKELTVTFIDVGQGAAALIETPCKAVIMVDAGGEPSFRGDPGRVGDTILLPYFRYKGVRKIDLAIITHPHEDHFGGFIPLIDEVFIDRLLISPAQGDSPYYFDLLSRANEKGININEAEVGQIWQCGDDLLLEIIAPPQKLFNGTGSDLNNNSIVFLLHYGQVRLLFTGDIEDAAVNDLLNRGLELKADLLLVPHHGGYLAAMPALLDKVKPSFAVIQVGPNSFGHPHPYVLEALEVAGVELYRNDEHGAVVFQTDGIETSISATKKMVPIVP